MTILGSLLVIVMGLVLGLLGGGGSILAVPIFKYALGFGAKEAIASSLAVVGVASLFGITSHWREGNVNLRTALAFGLPAAAGAFLGAKVLAGLLSGAVQLALFAVVMLVASFLMFRDNEKPNEKDKTDDHSSLTILASLMAVGVGAGILTGLVGVGGGFLIVPALVLLGNVPMKQAVGTSLLVITANSLSGFVGYLGSVEFRWGLMELLAALAVGGSLVGGHLVRLVPGGILRKSFAVFLIAMGVFILYETRGVVPLL